LIALCLLVVIGVVCGVGFGTGAFTESKKVATTTATNPAPVSTGDPSSDRICQYLAVVAVNGDNSFVDPVNGDDSFVDPASPTHPVTSQEAWRRSCLLVELPDRQKSCNEPYPCWNDNKFAIAKQDEGTRKIGRSPIFQ
jgi:hypothetical protein